MNKKSLFQMVLLVVLVVAGAVGYVYMQEGNLDFITQLVGDAPVKISAPAPKSRVVTRPAKPAPVTARKPEAPEIPAQPAKGQVGGKSFTVEAAVFEGGALTLRQGADSAVRVDLTNMPWSAPAGKVFKFTPTSSGEPPQVAIRWKDAGQARARVKRFGGKYTLQLEFGSERDNKLPGKIYLVLPAEAKTSIAGTFEADIRGFRIVNGKPDLSVDSIDTLQFLALREVLQDDPNKPMQNLTFHGGHYVASTEAAMPTGYIELQYQSGEARPQVQKFQFVKQNGEWRIQRAEAQRHTK